MYGFKTRAMLPLRIAAILEPRETARAQTEQSEVLLPQAFQMFSSQQEIGIQLYLQNHNINYSTNDSGGAFVLSFTAKSLPICYLPGSHLHHAEQFFCE